MLIVKNTCLVALCFIVTVLAHASELKHVEHVIDGDTVVLGDGTVIRLIGINAPENENDQNQAEPYALEATLLLTELVAGKKIRITRGAQKKDGYGRTLAYIDLPDNTDIQEQLVFRGFARVIAFPPNIERLVTYQKAEAVARSTGSGVWSRPELIVDLDMPDASLDDGFRMFSGTVMRVKSTKKNVHLEFGGQVSALIKKSIWSLYWGNSPPQDYVAQRIEIRGWVNSGGGRKWLHVRHPSMLVELPREAE